MENLESIQSIQSVVLVIHLILALGIIALVLIQRSEGGGLGIGGGGGLGGFASARGTANMLTRMTAIFAAGFFITSLALGILAAKQSSVGKGFLENVKPAVLEKAEANPEEMPKADIKFEPPTAAGKVDPSSAEKEAPQSIEEGADKNAVSPENAEKPAAEEQSPVETPVDGVKKD